MEGTKGNGANYWIYPLSPTRLLVGVSPYFKCFFPQIGDQKLAPDIPAFFDKDLFSKHFYEPLRMELFEPCINFDNKHYTYKVHYLTEHEVHYQNVLVLNEEQEEFVFHDYNKIRDSFWAYEKKFTMDQKNYDYSKWI